MSKRKGMGRKALIDDCLANILSAPDVEAIEAAFQEGHRRLTAEYGAENYMAIGYRRAADKLRWEGANVRGRQLAEALPVGRFLPRIEARRRLVIDGTTYSIGYGGNSTGERYAWHYAKEWARKRLEAAGCPEDVVRETLGWWGWPHRALRALLKWDSVHG